jgi:hypothetical protein
MVSTTCQRSPWSRRSVHAAVGLHRYWRAQPRSQERSDGVFCGANVASQKLGHRHPHTSCTRTRHQPSSDLDPCAELAGHVSAARHRSVRLLRRCTAARRSASCVTHTSAHATNLEDDVCAKSITLGPARPWRPTCLHRRASAYAERLTSQRDSFSRKCQSAGKSAALYACCCGNCVSNAVITVASA